MPQSTSQKDATRAGWFLASLSIWFLTVLMITASMAPGYDIANGAISDLGTVPETAFLFNASLIAVGVLNAAGGWFLFRANRHLPTFIIALIAAVGAAGAGIINLNTPGIHGIFALLAFIFFNIECLMQARGLPAGMKWAGRIFGTIGLVYVVIMFFGDSGYTALFGPIGHGGSERMIVYPPMLWLLLFGGYQVGIGRSA